MKFIFVFTFSFLDFSPGKLLGCTSRISRFRLSDDFRSLDLLDLSEEEAREEAASLDSISRIFSCNFLNCREVFSYNNFVEFSGFFIVIIIIIISVAYPYHFDADPGPDPDPRIRFRDDGSGSGL